jgi:hypothetical protein
MGPAHFVFLDETAATTAMTRLYGWGPRSERLVDAAPRRTATGTRRPSLPVCAMTA